MMFGLTMTYDRACNTFFVVHGEAGTGKSTTLNILAKLSAGNTCTLSLAQFHERFQNYPLTEKRLNLVHDMEVICGNNMARGEAILKSGTCGEKISVEKKYVGIRQRYMTAIPVFGCNTLPRFADRSLAISDRMRIISFPNIIRGTAAQDTSLPNSLEMKVSGIFNWALKGYAMLRVLDSPTFPESESAKAVKAESIRSNRPWELLCDEFFARGCP